MKKQMEEELGTAVANIKTYRCYRATGRAVIGEVAVVVGGVERPDTGCGERW
jgi:hypothetical protein